MESKRNNILSMLRSQGKKSVKVMFWEIELKIYISNNALTTGPQSSA